MDLNEGRVYLPPPDLEPREITMEQYHDYAPEKFELLDGHLFLPATYPELRQQLLKLLLVNVGLREAVRMAPKAAWREALERAADPVRGRLIPVPGRLKRARVLTPCDRQGVL